MFIQKYLLPGPQVFQKPNEKDQRFMQVEIAGNAGLFTHARRHPQTACLFFHGNGESASEWTELLDRFYRDSTIQIYLVEYRGYAAAGDCIARSEKDLIEDGLACFDAISEKMEIVLWGRSLGGAVAAQIAARRNPSKLILQSTFPRLSYAISRLTGIPEFLGAPIAKLDSFELNTEKALRKVSCPLLILHGAQDEMFPIETAVPRLKCAKGSKVEVLQFEGGHDDDGSIFWHKRIVEFISPSHTY
jgi:pimeloyl-ACP methyl ester carboxylesterase